MDGLTIADLQLNLRMNSLILTESRAAVVVALDFGTTFSGFAFACTSEPDQVHKYYEWPDLRTGGGANYCKTQTSLLYEDGESPGSYVLQDWGYSALVRYVRGIQTRQCTTGLQQMSIGEHTFGSAHRHQWPPVVMSESASRKATYFITHFKLLLAGAEAGRISASTLPAGLTVRRVISDYLRRMSLLIMDVLRDSIGNHITREDVQWCLTVPAMWDERGKQEMKTCAEIAGMVRGLECPVDSLESASPHQIMIAIEPEAASLYCQRKIQRPLTGGDKFLIVDVGGGTVDLVLHQKVGMASSFNVREVSPSSGGLCGGSYVDDAFFDFLASKISCFRAFSQRHPDSILKLKGWWENIKYGFDGNMRVAYDLELPARLARAWEEDDYTKDPISNLSLTYDAIELSLEDMHRIFDPVVNQILELIEHKMIKDLKSMMIVGGFSGSPYLVKRIRQEFSSRVGTIVIPNEPGSAICCGAVAYGLYGPDVILSRISRKTYGIRITRSFDIMDPAYLMFQGDDGESFCEDVFDVYTTIGDEVPLDHCVRRNVYPTTKDQTQTCIGLYSTVDLDPKYVCDPGITKEGSFIMIHPSHNELMERPRILVSMYFGRTTVELEAEGKNFGTGEKFRVPPMRFEKYYA